MGNILHGQFGHRSMVILIVLICFVLCNPGHGQESKEYNYLPNRIIAKEAKYFRKAQRKFDLPSSDSLHIYWDIWYPITFSPVRDENLTTQEFIEALNKAIKDHKIEATMEICNRSGYTVASISSYGNYYELYQKSTMSKYCYENNEKFLIYTDMMDSRTRFIVREDEILVADFDPKNFRIMKLAEFIKCCMLNSILDDK